MERNSRIGIWRRADDQQSEANLSAVHIQITLVLNMGLSLSGLFLFNFPLYTDLQCIVLKDRKTCFWRGQDKPDSYLATIEAIYYFMVDYQKAFGSEVSDLHHHDDDPHRYDDLLYFYSFMYDLVHRGESDDTKRTKIENGWWTQTKGRCMDTWDN